MEALTHIAPALDTAALLAQVHVAPDSEDAATVIALIDRAREVARPKALYAEAFVEGRGDDTVRIGGLTFTSRALRRKLDTVERVFPYVATCGHEMDSVALPADDVLVGQSQRDRLHLRQPRARDLSDLPLRHGRQGPAHDKGVC